MSLSLLESYRYVQNQEGGNERRENVEIKADSKAGEGERRVVFGRQGKGEIRGYVATGG